MSYISDCVVLHFTVIYLYFQNIKSLVQKVKKNLVWISKNQSKIRNMTLIAKVKGQEM